MPGQGLFRAGEGEMRESHQQPGSNPAQVQSPGPSPTAPAGRAWAWAGQGARQTLSTGSCPSCLSSMSSVPAPGPAPACLTLWDEEDFQGLRCRLLSDCANVCERGGLRRVRSVKVESGA